MTERDAVAPLGCWGRGPKPPTVQDKEGSQHGRRRSLSWWGRGAVDAADAAPEGSERPADERNLADALAGLQLDELQQQAQQQQQQKAGGKAAAAAGPMHRRRWSFGRQVAPLPELAPSRAQPSEAAGPAEDDLLRTSSDLSLSSQRSSPTQLHRRSAQRQQQHGPSPRPSPNGLSPRPSPGWPGSDDSPTTSSAEPEVATPPRGQGGYRRLWHSISSVRKGDPLPAAAGGACGDVTVDSLVRAVQRLKPAQAVTEAVAEGLARLDSRATAALLKELSKAGLPHRAAELFDWLRGLPRAHALAPLADLYTYTTIISQCGSHQALRRALELVGEMRARGVEANIHTYSALMGVCVKCNECDLALDVFQQLLAEGCTPNLVTFNILVDIHSKRGRWAAAMEVLDQLAARGIAAEARCYNVIISACSKAGQPAAALAVYERMLEDGVQPTGTTFTSLISAFGKAGQVEEALRVYQDMRARGCERNVITYSSLISACERAGRCDLAMGLWAEMRREGCRPNVVTYNALLGACAHAGSWVQAAEVWDSLLASGVRPDAVTFSLLVAAYERGGQWRRCLQAFERMQQAGFRPDACAYNSVLDALVGSGLVSALLKGVQLLAAAHRQGHLRLAAVSAHESAATAHTHGAAFLTALRWLAELREAPPAGAMPLAFAAGAGLAPHVGLQPVSLSLTRGKHCRGDQSYAPIQASLQACFDAFSAPVAAKLTPQGGLLLHADAFALTAWLATPSAAALLSPLAAAAAGGGASAAGAQLSGALLADDVAADMQCAKAFAAVLEFEAARGADGGADACAQDASAHQAALRQALVGSIVAVATRLGVQEETALDAVQLCDRTMAAGVAMEAGLAPLYAAAMLLLCCRQSGEAAALLDSAALLPQLIGLPLSTVLEAEAHLAGALGGDAAAVSALRVLQLYLERLGYSLPALQKCQLLEVAAVAAVGLARKAALSPAFVRFRPSVVAAACLARARESLGLAPAWPRALASMTGYLPGAPGSPLAQCLEVMALLRLA